jgi:hypothetical protein
VAAAVAAFVVLELVFPGQDLPWFAWLALVVVLGIVAIGCLSARRVWTVRVDSEGRRLGCRRRRAGARWRLVAAPRADRVAAQADRRTHRPRADP